MSEDLKKAKRIVGKRKSWVGRHGALQENIALAVAEGIAQGRKEGFELAVKLLRDETESAGKPR
jgi:hypothetical protein